MTGSVRRAAAFAAIGSLALAAPALGRAAALAFLAVAALAAFVIRDGPLFELFARPGDRRDGKLYGLAGFSLAATGLALLATLPVFGLPVPVFVGAVLLLSYGNLGEQLGRTRSDAEIVATVGFGTAGFLAAAGGMLFSAAVGGADGPALPEVVFLAAGGTLLAALLRAVLFGRDDPLVMLSAGLLLWFLYQLGVETTLVAVSVALGVTLALGYLSFALETASVPGMLTGVFLGLLTLVLGGPGWFVVLIAFFGLGGLATKYRYEEKRARGVAQENEGARGSGNVLGNSAVALLALLGFAASSASPDLLQGAADPFRFAFAGSIAAAMSDTLSSEIGGLFDDPRLITTMEVVEPGTDGGVTWQGEVAGLAGAAAIAAIAVLLFAPVTPVGGAAIVVAGFVGMTVDSLLGATLEGRWLGNQGVNFLATLAGAATGAGLAVAVGATAL